MSSSGAYTVFIDPAAGSAGSKVGDRVVPLPHGQGGTHYKDVSLSLAYDDPTNPIPNPPNQTTAHCRFLKAPGGTVRTADIVLQVGVTQVPLQPGELAVHIKVDPVINLLAEVSAMVEYVGE